LRSVIERLRNVALAGATAAAATLPLVLATPAHAYDRPAIPAICENRAQIICIDKSAWKLYLFESGRAVMTLDVRFGAEDSPTRNGTFKIFEKEAEHKSRLAGSEMPYSMFFSGGEAIHYSADFAKNGYNNSSMGCVNTRDLNATQKLFSRVSVGTPVHVYGVLPAASSYDPHAYD
jgi:hypothetical protein